MSNKFRTPSGFPEYLPEQQKQFNNLRDIFAMVAESFAFVPLETPAVEYMDTLASKGDTNKEIYTIGRAMGEGDGKESDRGLRFDLTVPTARYVAQNYNDLVFPFKRYQVQPVWRGERPQKGRFRQFYQADLDVIANENLGAEYDAEVIMAMATALSQMNFGPVTFQVNNRKFLSALVSEYGSNNIAGSIQAIDKIQKISNDELVNQLTETGIKDGEELITKLQPVNNDELDNYFAQFTSENLQEGINEIKELFENLEMQGLFGLENVNVLFNPAIARGLDYYTGTIVETTIDGYQQYGSICSGGRYADLASRFINKSLPGFGMSIGLSRLFDVLSTENLLPESIASNKSVFIGILDAEQEAAILATAGLLREQGINVEVFYDSRRDFAKQQKLADRKGADFLVCESDGSFTLIQGNKKIKASDFDSLLGLLI